MTDTALKKRILTDATMTSANLLPNNVPKKRKLDVDEPTARLGVPPRSSAAKSFGSSQVQQKSRFEEDLEKLTQDINGLKENNSEKDQQWDRPPLDEFDPAKDNLCFQQIDVEDGMLDGRAAVKLFGVNEVGVHDNCMCPYSSNLTLCRKETLFFSMSRIFNIIY
jgi:DNA polymerase delta subunit 1